MLLVTGAYYPEISAAAVQCRAVAAAMGARAQLSILTTAVDRSLPVDDEIDGRSVTRVPVDVRSRASKALASVRLARHMLRSSGTFDMIHVHGFSQKNVPVSILARLLRKPVVLTLHTAGQDEWNAVRRSGRVAAWAFASAAFTTAVSPVLVERWHASGLPGDRICLVPNGIDTRRFRPADAAERVRLRRQLQWPEDAVIALFVGFFSRDKRPDLLVRAWRRLAERGVDLTVVFVGAKGGGYYEIDESLSARVAEEAAASGRADRIRFVDAIHDVDRYYRAADLFVLPSVREAHPLALAEAMASGLPCVATRLPGATDAIIEDGVNGRLFPPDDEAALAASIAEVVRNPDRACAMGASARAAVVERYGVERTAEAWLAVYDRVMESRT